MLRQVVRPMVMLVPELPRHQLVMIGQLSQPQCPRGIGTYLHVMQLLELPLMVLISKPSLLPPLEELVADDLLLLRT